MTSPTVDQVDCRRWGRRPSSHERSAHSTTGDAPVGFGSAPCRLRLTSCAVRFSEDPPDLHVNRPLRLWEVVLTRPSHDQVVTAGELQHVGSEFGVEKIQTHPASETGPSDPQMSRLPTRQGAAQRGYYTSIGAQAAVQLSHVVHDRGLHDLSRSIRAESPLHVSPTPHRVTPIGSAHPAPQAELGGLEDLRQPTDIVRSRPTGEKGEEEPLYQMSGVPAHAWSGRAVPAVGSCGHGLEARLLYLASAPLAKPVGALVHLSQRPVDLV